MDQRRELDLPEEDSRVLCLVDGILKNLELFLLKIAHWRLAVGMIEPRPPTTTNKEQDMATNPDGIACVDCEQPVLNSQEHVTWYDVDYADDVFAHVSCEDVEADCPCGCEGDKNSHSKDEEI